MGIEDDRSERLLIERFLGLFRHGECSIFAAANWIIQGWSINERTLQDLVKLQSSGKGRDEM